MLSSSKSGSTNDARFDARLDVLMGRIDTLAATVATTASAIAKKDGEIASLRRDLQSRDEALQALVAQARLSSQTPAGGPAIDPNELRSLKNAVAALTKEHVEGGSNVEALAASVRSLGQRVEELATTSSTSTEPDRPSDELSAMLAALRGQVEALGGMRVGVTEERLDQRFAETEGALGQLAQRIDSLAGTVEAAAASLGDKEHELAGLHRDFTESSTRIESIVDDIREALSAFPELSASSVDELGSRLEHVERMARETVETHARETGDHVRRLDAIEERVGAVASEVARAKTLWPVALRSLEARLDDVGLHARRPEQIVEQAAPETGESPEPSDDLLAGLRDSLQAMESVAAEMARAADTLVPPAEEADALVETPVAAAGATIVPLRASEP